MSRIAMKPTLQPELFAYSFPVRLTGTVPAAYTTVTPLATS